LESFLNNEPIIPITPSKVILLYIDTVGYTK